MRKAGNKGGMWSAVIVALLLLGSTIEIAPGQEATGEISVSVRPAGTIETDPVPTAGAGGDTRNPSAGTTPTAPDHATGAPAQGGEGEAVIPASLPGTVTAHLELHSGDASAPGDLPTLLVVRDDRGTAAGSTVLLISPGEDDRAGTLSLVANHPGTIVRILPVGPVPVRHGEVLVGRTLDSLAAPAHVLHAPASGGAGVYTHQLVIRYPGLAAEPGRLFIIQLPSAP
jgi:hypothetical protein